MTNKERVVQKPAKQGSVSPAVAKAAVKKVTEDRKPAKAKKAKVVQEQVLEPTIEQLQAGQENLSKLLVISNQKLVSSLDNTMYWKERYFSVANQSWWSLTKERFVFMIKDWISLFN